MSIMSSVRVKQVYQCGMGNEVIPLAVGVSMSTERTLGWVI